MSKLELQGKAHKPVSIIIEYDDGDSAECSIEDVDPSYRDNVIEDIEHAYSVAYNKRQLRALGFMA